jgi:hypothetical protein
MKKLPAYLALVFLPASSALAAGDGLRAEYRNLGGTTVIKTVEGEGPIEHGYSWQCYWAGQGFTYYEGRCELWAGIWDGWGRFEETLTGYIRATQTGPHILSGTTDDDHVVTFQDVVVSEYHGSYGWFAFTVDLVAGEFYKIRIDYKNKGGSNYLNLAWEKPDGTQGIIPREHLYAEIPLVAVDVDIKPGSFPNSISLSSRGVLPVAILGGADFDAETIDPESLTIGGVTLALRGSARAPVVASSLEDANDDGFTDRLAFFDVPALVAGNVLTKTTGALEVLGSLYDGTLVKGMDSVRIVP